MTSVDETNGITLRV